MEVRWSSPAPPRPRQKALEGRRRSYTERSALPRRTRLPQVERSPLSLSSSSGKRALSGDSPPHTHISLPPATCGARGLPCGSPFSHLTRGTPRGMELSAWEPAMEKGQPHRGLGSGGGVREHPSKWLCSSQKWIGVRCDQGAQQLAQTPDSDTHTGILPAGARFAEPRPGLSHSPALTGECLPAKRIFIYEPAENLLENKSGHFLSNLPQEIKSPVVKHSQSCFAHNFHPGLCAGADTC